MAFTGFKHRTLFHSIPILGLAALLAAAAPARSVSAEPSVRDLETKKEELKEEIEAADETLISTAAEIELLEDSIEENKQNIACAEEDLMAATESADQQLANMRLRMKYLYENGQENLFTVLASSANIGDFLNRVNYVREVQRHDAQMIASYEATREGIVSLRTELEAERQKLTVAKEDLKNTKEVLDDLLKERQRALSDTDRRLAEAKAKEMAAEAAQQLTLQNSSITTTEEVLDGDDPRFSTPRYTEGSSGSSGAFDPGSTVSGGNGKDVVAFAKQFVGNPYVWGGNSLTEGCDCSGFVVQIYKHFGVDLSAHRNSALLRDVGAAVSFQELAPGDIVCYSGHVAIYAGDGQIVEAQSSRTGITCGRPVAYKQILAIRRIFG